jgi:hypothetical protein
MGSLNAAEATGRKFNLFSTWEGLMRRIGTAADVLAVD